MAPSLGAPPPGRHADAAHHGAPPPQGSDPPHGAHSPWKLAEPAGIAPSTVDVLQHFQERA
eukprot:3329310-Prorocentrum_lima.AAC.1